MYRIQREGKCEEAEKVTMLIPMLIAYTQIANMAIPVYLSSGV